MANLATLIVRGVTRLGSVIASTITADTFKGNLEGTIGGHKVEKDVPSTAVFTDTTYTAATAAPGKVASASAQGTSTNYARQDHTHGIDLATGDANGQVKIAGTNVSVKGLADLAYKASLGKSDVGLGNVDNTADTNKSVASAAKLTTGRTINGIGFDGSANVTGYGICSTPAATAAKEVTLENSTAFTLAVGSAVYVKFSVTNSAAVASLTLNVNGTGEKNIKRYGTTNMAAVGNLTAGMVCHFVFDGTYWLWVGHVDTNSNTYDRIYFSSSLVKAGGAAIANKNIIVAESNGLYKHLKLGTAFDTRFPILYANANIAANAASNSCYPIIPFEVTTTQAITLTAQKPVYIKGALSGTMFTPISTTPLTQDEPITADGYLYMRLGVAYSTTAMYLLTEHPIYKFSNGAFRLYNGELEYTFDASTGTLTFTD